MRKFRVFALILSVLLAVGMCFVGCTSNNDITVTLKFTDAEGNTFWEQPINVNAKNPTVQAAVNEAGATYPNLGVEWTEYRSLTLTDYPDTELMFWECTVDGKTPETKAADAAISDGSVIAYVYTAIEDTSTDDEDVTDTEDVEDTEDTEDTEETEA